MEGGREREREGVESGGKVRVGGMLARYTCTCTCIYIYIYVNRNKISELKYFRRPRKQ